MSVSCAVVGATGYTGAELLRLAAGHPELDVQVATSRSEVGQQLSEQHPSLRRHALGALRFEAFEPDAIAERCEVAFLCLPHGASAEAAEALLARGLKVLDLSADFRLRSAARYEQWYREHPCPELLPDAVYGLPERYRESIRGARLVALPGCYPTSVILGLAPALEAEALVEGSGLVADSKSGVSGAGRSPKPHLHFPEVFGDFSAYGLAGHRHAPEMEQELRAAAGVAEDDFASVDLLFTPHLLPVSRGILSTLYARLHEGVDEDAVRARYASRYEDEPFVTLLPPGEAPRLKEVAGTNHCLLQITVDSQRRRLRVVAAIDNLVKGAAGQAVQCFNLLSGFDETLGLEAPAANP